MQTCFFFFPPRVPLASDTSVPQLRISLKTFDKSRSPQGISRDSLNPQLGQTDCQRGSTDLGAVCLCGCTTTRRRQTLTCCVYCVISLCGAGFNSRGCRVFVRSDFLSPSLTFSPPRWLTKQMTRICCGVGSERNAKTSAASEISRIFHPRVQYSPDPSAPVPSPKDRKTNSTARILTLVWSIPPVAVEILGAYKSRLRPTTGYINLDFILHSLRITPPPPPFFNKRGKRARQEATC